MGLPLSCAPGEFAEWNGSAWVCTSAETGWLFSGNAGTTPGTDFLGTTDNQALELKVNNTRVLRLEPDATSPNIIAGHSSNNVATDVYGATISGGGRSGYPNEISGNYGSIGGGLLNIVSSPYSTISGGGQSTASGITSTVGGGWNNVASGDQSTIAGGGSNIASGINATIGGGGYDSGTSGSAGNIASGDFSTISGGAGNEASELGGTVAGGIHNTASGPYATITGGLNNTASGWQATVAGGEDNTAAGYNSFAAGRRARANNQGCFVWGDSTSADIECNDDNRFVVWAADGVYLYTNSSLISGAYLAAGASSWDTVSDRNLKEHFVEVDVKDVAQRVAEMPITTWSYKAQAPEIRHIGPMAQDFYAAFGLGIDERHINTIDADGVALAAIQGLYQMIQERDAKITELQQQKTQLEAQQATIEILLQRLAVLEQTIQTPVAAAQVE